jgi:hypothetical protein
MAKLSALGDAQTPFHKGDQGRMEGRIFNLEFDKGFEILDLTMQGGYSILSRMMI